MLNKSSQNLWEENLEVVVVDVLIFIFAHWFDKYSFRPISI